jgi:hypothetical protein
MDQLTVNKLVLEQIAALQERVEDLEMLEPRIAELERRCDFFDSMIAKVVRIAELDTTQMKEVQAQLSGVKLGLRELDYRTKHLRPE